MTALSSLGQANASAQLQHPSQPRRIPIAISRVSLFIAIVAAFTLLGAGSAFASISRDNVLTRAQTWVDNPVPYSQLKYSGGYRTDCSGYVSMCWKTGTSWSTATFHNVTHRIAVDSLRPGDAMLIAGYHIRLFYGWVDAAHQYYVCYEQTGPCTKSSIKSMASDLARGYLPVRYNGIVDGPAPDNALMNGSFDVWASSDPVWWAASATGTDTPVVRRQDVHVTSRNALQLDNPTTNPRDFSELKQTSSVSPETTYTLAAWARTTGDPMGLELHVRYFDASGTPVAADTRTSGDAWGVKSSGFAKMSLTAFAPARAAKAEVTLRLAGGRDASGTVGVAAVFDDVSLIRPRATITMRQSATVAYSRQTVTLSGSVTPTSAIGTNIIVWVKKPGTSRWSYSSNRTVYALGAAAAWQYKYYFKPGMTKGVYAFTSECPALPGWLGASSPTTAFIRLK